MKTADDFLSKDNPNYKFDDYDYYKVKEFMIKFAELHVQAALKEASEKARTKGKMGSKIYQIDKTTILNAYPLTNII